MLHRILPLFLLLSISTGMGQMFPVPDFVKNKEQDPSDAPKKEGPSIKFKARWQEKKGSNDTRSIIVFIRAENGQAVNNEEVAILIRGKTMRERRATRTTITIGRNQEIGVVVPMDSTTTENDFDFFGIHHKTEKPAPVTQVQSVMVTLARDFESAVAEADSKAAATAVANGATPGVKLNVRWEELQNTDGSRRIRVTIQNTGTEDLDDEDAAILLKGKTPNEQRFTTTKITVARNERIAVIVPLEAKGTENHIDFFGIVHNTEKDVPITEVQSAEVTVRKDLKFSSQ